MRRPEGVPPIVHALAVVCIAVTVVVLLGMVGWLVYWRWTCYWVGMTACLGL